MANTLALRLGFQGDQLSSMTFFVDFLSHSSKCRHITRAYNCATSFLPYSFRLIIRNLFQHLSKSSLNKTRMNTTLKLMHVLPKDFILCFV